MPNWAEIISEIEVEKTKNPDNQNISYDIVRKRYLSSIATITGRNIIAYYSGWLNYPRAESIQINDKDILGFMLSINELDRTKGLDLILHTPGGDIAAAEAIVSYLREMFGNDIRVIVPQLSQSAGTMIALSAKEIVMGKHSSLGPIDPQFNGIPCQGVIEEFETAQKEILLNPVLTNVWSQILSKYHPTFVGSCRRAIAWSIQLVENWLSTNMLSTKVSDVPKVVEFFSDHNSSKNHARHFSKKDCQLIGLNISDLESNQALQDAVLSLHHCYMLCFSSFLISKIIENEREGITYTEFIQVAA